MLKTNKSSFISESIYHRIVKEMDYINDVSSYHYIYLHSIFGNERICPLSNKMVHSNVAVMMSRIYKSIYAHIALEFLKRNNLKKKFVKYVEKTRNDKFDNVVKYWINIFGNMKLGFLFINTCPKDKHGKLEIWKHIDKQIEEEVINFFIKNDIKISK